jgi:hypothetical protein
MKNKYPVPKTAITERGLKQLMKKAAKEHASLSDWAKSKGITPQAVSAFIRKTQGAGLQIPEALGYRPQIVFIPLDEELIATPNPPRRATARPTKKVDHTREPVERAHRKQVNDREETKKRLKARKR